MIIGHLGLDLIEIDHMQEYPDDRRTMTFRQYIHLLAEKVGLHQLPVIPNANEIRYFLAEDAVHHQFVTTLVRDIYKRNRCGHLDAGIDPAKTMSLLGTMRSSLLTEKDADICRVRLMNQLCEISTLLLDKKEQSIANASSNEDFPEMVKI